MALLEDAGRLARERDATARGVFPSARARAQLRAVELEEQLFEDFVRTQLGDGCSGLPPERVRGGTEVARLPGRDPQQLKLMIRADRHVDTGRLNQVIDRIRGIGVGAARLATEVPR